MFGVDDEVARRQRRQLGQEGVGALLALAPPHQPVAEHILLGQHRHVWSGKAVIERQDQQRGDVLRAKRFLPVVDHFLAGQAMVLEQSGQPLASAGRVACQNDFLTFSP